MTKFIVSIAAIVAMALATGCSDDSEKTVSFKLDNPIVTDSGAVVLTLKNKDTLVTSVPVGEKNFRTITDYIEKYGFSVNSGHQYTFFDKAGNRHALITVKHDAHGKVSKNGEVTSISVWAYYGGKKDQDHFFGWDMTPTCARTFITDSEYVKKHLPAVKKGYEDLLAHVSK